MRKIKLVITTLVLALSTADAMGSTHSNIDDAIAKALRNLNQTHLTNPLLQMNYTGKDISRSLAAPTNELTLEGQSFVG